MAFTDKFEALQFKFETTGELSPEMLLDTLALLDQELRLSDTTLDKRIKALEDNLRYTKPEGH
jgi:hypothetical protein